MFIESQSAAAALRMARLISVILTSAIPARRSYSASNSGWCHQPLSQRMSRSGWAKVDRTLRRELAAVTERPQSSWACGVPEVRLACELQ